MDGELDQNTVGLLSVLLLLLLFENGVARTPTSGKVYCLLRGREKPPLIAMIALCYVFVACGRRHGSVQSETIVRRVAKARGNN